MEPLPPAGSPHGRCMPPSLLRPSCSAFSASADGHHEAAVSEHPCVTLVEWWLATVEGDDQKIAVAGTFERNQTLEEYSPAPIAKRHTQFLLETEDGTILCLNHFNSHNVSRTYSNGYSRKVCNEFLNGFPHWWQSCKPTNSHTQCQPCSSNTGVDSTQFYLEKYEQGKYLINKFEDLLKKFSSNDAVFQKSSHLLNGTPRFEEYTCDGAATSSEPATGDQRSPVVSLEVHGCHKETRHMSLTEKAAVDEMPASVYLDMQNSSCLSNGMPILEEGATASNNDNERYTAISKEMNNIEKGLVTGSPSRERGHDDIATVVSLALTVECTNNTVIGAVVSTPATDTYCKNTRVASLKSQGPRRENQHIASNKKPVGRSKKKISPHEKRQSATRSPETRSPVSYVLRSALTRGQATLLSMSTPEALKLKRTRSGREIVPEVDGGCQSIVNRRPVGRPKKKISPHEKRQSATRSPGTRSPVSYVLWSPLTRGKATSLSMSTPEALKLKRTRSGRVIVPKLDEGCQSIVYGRDGLIAAVIGLDSPAMPKWSESKTDRRKKRRTE